MQETSALTLSQTPLKGEIEPEKVQLAKSKSWFSRLLFSCCQPESPNKKGFSVPLKKSISTGSTHYSNKGPNSFIIPSKNSPFLPIALSIPENKFQLELAFLLGKGSNKIISKISKIDLSTKSPDSSIFIKNSPFIFDQTPTPILKKEAKKFSRNHENSLSSLKSNSGVKLNPSQVFSLYSNEFQMEKNDLNELAKELIGLHAAEKFQNQLVVDALCGTGGNSIQFARYSPHVIGIEVDVTKIKQARNNVLNYRMHDRVDLVNANFLSLNKIKADVVFLAPSLTSIFEITGPFSIEKNLAENLLQLIHHSLTVAESVCIMLPPYTDLEEVASLFCSIFNENPNKYTNINYTLQLDLLYIGESFVSILVHFGGNNKISKEEQIDVLLNTMNLNNELDKLDIHSKGLIQQLTSYVGTHCCLKVILSLEDFIANENIRDGFVFENFLSKLKDQKIISREILKQFSKMDVENINEAMKSPFGLLKTDNMSPRMKMQKKSSDRSSLKSPFKFAGAQNQPQKDNFRITHHLTCNVECAGATDSSDISAFALSSYSLNSAALLDSDSEDERPTESKTPLTRDSAKMNDNCIDLNASVPLKRGVSRQRTSSINRVKMLLFNLANQKVAASPLPFSGKSANNSFPKAI